MNTLLPQKCPTCDGTGTVAESTRFMGVETTKLLPCKECEGTGHVWTAETEATG